MTTYSESIQWSYDFIRNFYLSNVETISEREKIYLNYLHPFSEKYYGPTNPVLLLGGADIEQLMKKDVWTIRDGIIPLSVFFAENTLNEKKLQLMIHKDLWFMVPEKWRTNVSFYEITAEMKFSKANLPKRIIIMGSPNDTLADNDEFEEDIELLSTTLGKSNIEKMEVVGYFPNKRTDLWGKWQDENIFKYSKKLFNSLKMDIKFPEWQLLKSEMNCKNTLYYEVNRGHFIKDSYPLHLFLSRGAGLLEDINRKGPLIETGKVKLSLYHNMVTYKLDEANCGKYVDPLSDELMPYFRKIIERGTNPRNVGASWEAWFGSFIKKHYKNKELN